MRSAFSYLLVRDAYTVAGLVIKIQDETFEKRLQEVEKYLDNTDWTLANILVRSLIGDYDNLFFEKLRLMQEDSEGQVIKHECPNKKKPKPPESDKEAYMKRQYQRRNGSKEQQRYLFF
jgi:hypothetical protein